jgi:F420-non-reducing hydrogenase iron-sulfur subunit
MTTPLAGFEPPLEPAPFEPQAFEPQPFEPHPFEPKIVGFLCNWCSYAGADKAGAAEIPYAPNVQVIRVMCSGRVDPQFVLQAYRLGADGVLILGCHTGDCHYKEGNYRAIQRHRLLLQTLKQFGIEEQRCRLDFVAASEGEKYARVLTEMVESIRALGPLHVNAEAAAAGVAESGGGGLKLPL